jgi:hypothetical protein
MHLVFIDDSEQRDPARQGLGNLIAVGAVMVPDDQLAVYAERLSEIRTDFEIPDGVEIKWKPRRKSDLAGVGLEIRMSLYRRMLEAAADCSVSTSVVVVDHGRAYKERSKSDVDKEILAWLYTRIEMHLGEHDDIGIVIADEPGGGSKAERRWLADTLELTEYGTQHVEAEHVVLPIVTAPSDHVPHLQLADLVTAATTAAVAGRPHALTLLDPLKSIARARPSGECGGAGLVLWPPPLYDLYWWLLEEPHLRRRNGVIALGPNAESEASGQDRPFLSQDGLNMSRQAS